MTWQSKLGDSQQQAKPSLPRSDDNDLDVGRRGLGSWQQSGTSNPISASSTLPVKHSFSAFGTLAVHSALSQCQCMWHCTLHSPSACCTLPVHKPSSLRRCAERVQRDGDDVCVRRPCAERVQWTCARPLRERKLNTQKQSSQYLHCECNSEQKWCFFPQGALTLAGLLLLVLSCTGR